MKRIVALVMLFLVLIGSPVQASSLQDSLIPKSDKTHSGSVELEFNKYPVSRYKLDLWIDATWNPLNVVGHISDEVQAIRLDLVNGIWSFSRIIFYFSIIVVGQAFELDIVETLIDTIGQSIQTIAGFTSAGFQDYGLWPMLILLMITLLGAWAAYVVMIRREQSRALSGILSMLVIFALSLGFFSQAGVILSGANTVSKELQVRILNISGKLMTPGKSYSGNEGIAVIQNQMFDILIKKPYLLMQYGSIAVDPTRVEGMLQLEYNSEERNGRAKDDVANYDNKMMSVDGLGDRFWFALLQFLAGLILAIQMLLMSGSVLFFQVIFIALVLFAPVPLLISLVPAWRDSAMGWCMKTLHALLMKVGVALLMTVIFTISGFIYTAIDIGEYGFLFVLGTQILVYIGIWWKRKELFSFATTLSGKESSHKGDAMSNYLKLRTAGRFAKTAFHGMSNFVKSNPNPGGPGHSSGNQWSSATRSAQQPSKTSTGAVGTTPIKGPNTGAPSAVTTHGGNPGGEKRKLVLLPGGVPKKNEQLPAPIRATDPNSLPEPSRQGALSEPSRDIKSYEGQLNGEVRGDGQTEVQKGETISQPIQARRKTFNQKTAPVIRAERNHAERKPVGKAPKIEEKEAALLQKSPRYIPEAKKYDYHPVLDQDEAPPLQGRMADPDSAFSWDALYELQDEREGATQRTARTSSKDRETVIRDTRVNRETVRHEQETKNRREIEQTQGTRNETVSREFQWVDNLFEEMENYDKKTTKTTVRTTNHHLKEKTIDREEKQREWKDNSVKTKL